jgi:hypothetical protein
MGGMSYREVSVIEVREILRLWLDGRSLRDVSRLSGGRSTQPEPFILHGLKPKRRGTWVGNGHSHR